MYTYFVSYIKTQKEPLCVTTIFGNATFEADQPLSYAVIKAFEQEEAKETGAENVVVINIQKLEE